MIILGIDPSLTGCAVSDGIRTEVLPETKPKGKTVRDRYVRYSELVREINDFSTSALGVVGFEHKYAFIEGYANASRGRGVLDMIELGWTLRCELHQNFDVIEVPPTTLKKFVTGSGVAKKNVMIKEIFKRWSEDFDDDNMADAYALQRLGTCVVDPALCTNQFQSQAVETIRKMHPGYFDEE